jgi:hypothetical protein
MNLASVYIPPNLTAFWKQALTSHKDYLTVESLLKKNGKRKKGY